MGWLGWGKDRKAEDAKDHIETEQWLQRVITETWSDPVSTPTSSEGASPEVA